MNISTIVSTVMTFLNTKVDGKKTYMVAAATLLGSLATYFGGEITLLEALQLSLPALLGALIRHGVTTDANAAAQKAVVTSYVLNNEIKDA